MTAYRRTTRRCAKHTDTPNTFRFIVCRKCGAGAMDQRTCSVCGRGYCRACQARAELIAAVQEAQELADYMERTVYRFENGGLAAAHSDLAADLFAAGLRVVQVTQPKKVAEEVRS